MFTSDETYKKYGSIVRFETGIRQFYVLNDFDQVKNNSNYASYALTL